MPPAILLCLCLFNVLYEAPVKHAGSFPSSLPITGRWKCTSSILKLCRGCCNSTSTLSEPILMTYPTVGELNYSDVYGLTITPPDHIISNISYIPPVPHARPTMFQCILTIPPTGKISLNIDVSKSFLRYTEHPPDAQRGWDLPPAVFVPLGAHERQTIDHYAARYPRIYTPILLADLATPDFSMPYNVIILSCTLITLVFGSIFNLLTRKFVVVEVEEQMKKMK